jgi:hypothetical protein
MKRTLLRAAVPLVVVVSDGIYQSIVAQGYPSIDSGSFSPMARICVGDRRHRGWVHVPEGIPADNTYAIAIGEAMTKQASGVA